jgi:hypothetical protein
VFVINVSRLGLAAAAFAAVARSIYYIQPPFYLF